MFQFLKKHLFWIVCGGIFALYFAFLAIIFFAPRADRLERGFIPCTHQLMDKLYACHEKKSIWCQAKAIVQNNACDFKVMKDGFKAWLEGRQETPFSNYYFEPVLDKEIEPDDEELKAFYLEHQNIVQEMEELNKKGIELEMQLEEKKNDEIK